jgi:hypothetical protein
MMLCEWDARSWLSSGHVITNLMQMHHILKNMRTYNP